MQRFSGQSRPSPDPWQGSAPENAKRPRAFASGRFSCNLAAKLHALLGVCPCGPRPGLILVAVRRRGAPWLRWPGL